ncbi:YiiD C-terminal domain-containing protein [Chitinivorax sp. PXF-14]|uniref:YiiD C-terminal domain-containing protein n=1 Tax=Chitinivorax sp. PXF-14 TaxID=3230488 RepID=UPI003465503C
MADSALQAELYRAIPLLAAMQVKVVQASEQGVTLAAPLEANRNDKGTAFAGSIGSLATVTGWCLASQLLPEAASIVAQETAIRYLKPIDDKFVAVCQTPDTDAVARFRQHFSRRGLARIELTVQVLSGGELGAELSGRYVASR